MSCRLAYDEETLAGGSVNGCSKGSSEGILTEEVTLSRSFMGGMSSSFEVVLTMIEVFSFARASEGVVATRTLLAPSDSPEATVACLFRMAYQSLLASDFIFSSIRRESKESVSQKEVKEEKKGNRMIYPIKNI